MVCAFTGHRNIKQEHRYAMPDLLRRAINFAYNQGCREFVAGGAVGFDTEAARQVLLFRVDHPDVRLVMFLPCLDQDSAWNHRQRDSYDYILSAADEVRYLSDNYDRTCMRRRNQAMADSCDIMIAYVGHDRSGASQTLRMAREGGKECYNLFSELDRGSR